MIDFDEVKCYNQASGRGDGNTDRRSNRNGSLGDRVMASRQLPSPEVLRQLLVYDQQVGSFIWKKRDASLFTNSGQHTAEHNCRVWNARYAGKSTGCVDAGTGYLRLTIMNRKIWAHRAAWLISGGLLSGGDQIDHIDGDRLNNRISNLRVVTHAENRRNMGRAINNTSGHVGVTWNSKNNNWNAKIGVGGRTIHLGCFDDIREAVAARKAAEVQFGFHENHGERASKAAAGYSACGGEIATEGER